MPSMNSIRSYILFAKKILFQYGYNATHILCRDPIHGARKSTRTCVLKRKKAGSINRTPTILNMYHILHGMTGIETVNMYHVCMS